MKFDFETDLKNELHVGFEVYGVKLPVRQKSYDSLLDYLTIRKKLIYPRPRTVLLSPELSTQLELHPKKREIDYLQTCFTKGDDVNFFQSKRLFQSNFHDHLAYEWNIHHLHLSLEKERKGKFYKQVNQLLFVYITDAKAIFLGADKHEEGGFGDKKWLDVLHDHFPDEIESYRDDQLLEANPIVDGKERQLLWDKGYTLFLTNVRNVVYQSPGIGRTLSGHSLLVVKQADEIMRWVFYITDQFTNRYNNICISKKVDPMVAQFRLHMGVETLEIIELTTNQLILTYPGIIDERSFSNL